MGWAQFAAWFWLQCELLVAHTGCGVCSTPAVLCCRITMLSCAALSAAQKSSQLPANPSPLTVSTPCHDETIDTVPPPPKTFPLHLTCDTLLHVC